jgi:hypothetical protein
MDQVNIFDVSTVLNNTNSTADGWYTQTITGTVPQPRVDFCLVLASAPDNSSHNIYMYGGRFQIHFNFKLLAKRLYRMGPDADQVFRRSLGVVASIIYMDPGMILGRPGQSLNHTKIFVRNRFIAAHLLDLGTPAMPSEIDK